jgi:O-acetyl-ADP-ribose deacetylase (regulator of RNase III)
MGRQVAQHTTPQCVQIRLVHGDLTEEDVDAIVNAANTQLAHGGGVAGAIVRRGGAAIQQESDAWVREHGPVTHTHPAVTSAGDLPCRWVIHAVGPLWGEGDEDAKLSAAVKGALETASERGFASLSMPAISTGVFGFPKERGARVILDAIVDFLGRSPETSLKDIRITVIDRKSVNIFQREFLRRWPSSTDEA